MLLCLCQKTRVQTTCDIIELPAEVSDDDDDYDECTCNPEYADIEDATTMLSIDKLTAGSEEMLEIECFPFRVPDFVEDDLFKGEPLRLEVDRREFFLFVPSFLHHFLPPFTQIFGNNLRNLGKDYRGCLAY